MVEDLWFPNTHNIGEGFNQVVTSMSLDFGHSEVAGGRDVLYDQ
jgi:hypothetical protein